ncbi:MAG TPA: serine/threonine-protein kinase, partial [Kofleriaceae bacterium]|nr:serine/threonine-protein kinase [Kofleriaceae bacterium]
MDARRLRIEELFARALEVEPAARAALLAEACGGDDELRREVESLVAHAPAGPRAFASVVRATAATLGAELRRPDLGARVGPYRLVSLLGEGGMGAVYVAERADDAFHKRVAIKVLRHGLASPEAIARFRDERQILARLEHPAIVRMLDGGAAEHGAPYLVMELVQGTPLAAYAASRRLRERIALMIAVCEAVHHAHQHLVVHRDLKPANILVDDGGRPKLLDFGIAKLLDPGEALAREARTVTGMALLTVEYASPEQARGDTVTVATDVYALGAVLYELLVGHPPQRAEADLVATLRRICDVDPPRPSQAAPPAARRALVGELDNIVMKALQKSPAARYPSVAALADDLRSFLDGRPISARDATWSYRAGKFVRRHRGALALATTIGIALAAAAVVALVAAGRARRQTRVAERRTRALLVEQGRQEVAAGRDSRALPYLAEVLAEGEDTPAIRLLVAEARRTVDRQVGATVVAPHGLDDVAWSSDGATLVLGGERGYLRLFDPDLHELRRLDRGASRSYGFARSPDGRALVASRWPSDPRAGGDDPGELRLLYADGRERSFPFACPHPAISDEHVACRRDEDGSFVVHDLDRGAEILARTVTGGVLIALAPDDRAVFVDRADGTIERWVLATGARELELRGHRGVIKKMIAAADGRLITCASDGTARVWDGERGRL